MLEESKTKYGNKGPPLDLSKFVQLLQFNRRWTYTGSLTTAPFSEGILWNVLEHVIPLRQTTLDMFLEYRKLEEKQFFNKFGNAQEKKEVEAKLSIQPKNVKPWTSQKGETFFRVAACNRVVQDVGDRPVYHIDIEPWVQNCTKIICIDSIYSIVGINKGEMVNSQGTLDKISILFFIYIQFSFKIHMYDTHLRT